MARLNINPRTLDSVANALNEVANNINIEKGTLENVYTTVDQGWKSQYTYDYLDEIYQVENNIERLTAGIYQIADCLRNMAAEVRRIDQENLNKIRG